MRISSFRVAMKAGAALLCVLHLAQTQTSPGPSAATQRGRSQFAQTCGFCHGVDASGGAEGPNLIRSALVRHDENGNLIAPVIRDGRPQKGMPPVPLSDAQIADVVAFLHWRLEESDRRSPGNPRDRDLKTLLTGDPARGKEFFYGAGECSRCHSPSGDLSGIAKKYAPADLEARFLYPSRVAVSAIVTTDSGAQFSGTLFYRDPFQIAIKDSAGWYHSWPVANVRVSVHDPLAAHAALLQTYTDALVHDVFAFLETLQ